MKNLGEEEPAKCKHGHEGFCGFCETESLPRCKHGNHGFCGFCEEEKGKPQSP